MSPKASARFLPRPFLVALAVLLMQTAFVALWYRYAIFPDLSLLPAGLPLQALDFGSTLGSFLLDPLLLFFAFYLIGRRLDLGFMWDSIVYSIFAGAVVAAFVGYAAVSPLVDGGGDLAYYSSYVASVFGMGWSLGSVVFAIIGEGLFTVSVAVAAIYYAEHRIGSAEPSGRTDEPGGALQEDGSAVLVPPSRQS